MSRTALKRPWAIRNQKALYKYEILQRFECGVVLKGTEVKSLRNQSASLDEAYARIDGEELWLMGFNISPYKFGNVMNHEPVRPRKLLLRKHEIRKLLPKVQQRGQTLVPLHVFFNERGWCKVTLALARGKTRGDRRQDLKKRDHQREMDRAMRRR